MKKLKMILIACLSAIYVVSFGQTTINVDNSTIDSVRVVKSIDKEKNETFLVANNKIVIQSENKRVGIVLSIYFMYDGTCVIVSNTYGLGTCGVKDQLDIMLDNGETIRLTSWKEFNCDGSGYFTVTKDVTDKLKSSPMQIVGIKNGKTQMKYMENVENKYKRYFIQLFKSYESKKFETIE